MIQKYAAVICLLAFQLGAAQFFKGDSEVKKFEGFFDFYYKAKEDKIFLVVEKLNQEFLYANALAQGVGSNDLGLDRGQMGGEKLVKFVRSGNKLLLLQPNQSYRAYTEDELEKNSVEEAFAKSVLWGFEIMEEQAASDAGYNKVYTAFKTFRDESYRWFSTSENTYGAFAFNQNR